MKRLNKILFIDDDEATNDYHKHICKKSNVAKDTLFFTSASAALAYLRAIRTKYDFPDLIFIDINMPEMDGHEFIDAVRLLPNFNENRTVLAYLVTTMTNIDVAVYAANGMKYFYFKTLTEGALTAAVEEIFNISTADKNFTVIDHRSRRL
jgi:CheY-like chemotaxis protein